MKGQLLKLSNKDVELLKKYGRKEEASCNGCIVTKKTAQTIYNLVESLNRREKGTTFGL